MFDYFIAKITKRESLLPQIIREDFGIKLKRGDKMKGWFYKMDGKIEKWTGKVVFVEKQFAYIKRDDNSAYLKYKGMNEKYNGKYFWWITKKNDGTWSGSTFALVDFGCGEAIKIKKERNKPMTKEEIKKELGELLRKYSCWTSEKHYGCIPDLAEEIFGLLKKERKDLLKKIEEMKKYSNDGSLLRDNRTYNQALEEVKQLLK